MTIAAPLLGDGGASAHRGGTRYDRWMSRLRTHPRSARLWAWLAPTLITLLAGVLRIVGLGTPHALVFDETYYVKDSWSQWLLGYPARWPEGADELFASGQTDVFTGDGSFVVHPPLGRWLMGAGMWLFGADSATGWRIAVAVFGTATVLLVYMAAKLLIRSTAFASVAAFLLAIDGLGIVMSRIGILDGVLTFFVLLTFVFVLLDRRRHLAGLAPVLPPRPRPDWGPLLWWRPWLLAAGAAAGAATAVKWSGLYVIAALGIYVVVTDALARRRAGIRYWPLDAVRQGLPSFLLFVPIAALTYLLTWTGWLVTSGGYGRDGDPNPLVALWKYHEATYVFHVGLTTGHSYASPAWEWPVLLRPTSMYWQNQDGAVQAISSIPNPFIWYGGVIAVIWLVARFVLRRDWRAAIVLVGIIATYVPWTLYPDRTIFQFYTVVMLPFMVLAIALALRSLSGADSPEPRRRATGQAWVWTLLAIAAVASAFWYPVWTAIPVPYEFWLLHNWMQSWI